VSRHAAIAAGHVPEGCVADSDVIWTAVQREQDPCATCRVDRQVCGGRPAPKSAPDLGSLDGAAARQGAARIHAEALRTMLQGGGPTP